MDARGAPRSPSRDECARRGPTFCALPLSGRSDGPVDRGRPLPFNLGKGDGRGAHWRCASTKGKGRLAKRPSRAPRTDCGPETFYDLRPRTWTGATGNGRGRRHVLSVEAQRRRPNAAGRGSLPQRSRPLRRRSRRTVLALTPILVPRCTKEVKLQRGMGSRGQSSVVSLHHCAAVAIVNANSGTISGTGRAREPGRARTAPRCRAGGGRTEPSFTARHLPNTAR